MVEKKKRVYRRHSPEFKAAAVLKVAQIGLKQTSKELGIASSTLSTWCKKASIDASNSSDKPSYEDLEKENRRLKKEIGYIEDINEVLKKSTAIFSSNQMGGLR